jgi:hypothetical protein
VNYRDFRLARHVAGEGVRAAARRLDGAGHCLKLLRVVRPVSVTVKPPLANRRASAAPGPAMRATGGAGGGR